MRRTRARARDAASSGVSARACEGTGRASAAGYDRSALLERYRDRFIENPTTRRTPVDDDVYDDEQDHTRCADCKGSGYYVGFTERRHCPTCEGSGFL